MRLGILPAVFENGQALGPVDSLGAGVFTGHHSGGQTGGRGFDHLGEDVVGAGGYGQDGHFQRALGHLPVGAVAAEGDQAPGSGLGVSWIPYSRAASSGSAHGSWTSTWIS